ncbi:HNH endonuclease [Gammaproteobacteria bacterium]
MNHVFVMDTTHRPLSMCHPARARALLKAGKAAVFRSFPFTIILKEEKPEAVGKPLTAKTDPGSKTTGIVLVDPDERVLFAAELEHRGRAIKSSLESRRALRRGRRNRRTRYRAPRFNNRRRHDGWLPPSLQHRVETTMTWMERFRRLCQLEGVRSQAKQPLSDAAAVNATRNKLFDVLLDTGLPVEIGTGAQTKFNRVKLDYPKAYWINAACVGDFGATVTLIPTMKPLQIKAAGHGNRQMCGTDKYVFPTRHRSRQKKHFGFETGDQVRANVFFGRKAGIYKGWVLCRASGSFDIKTVTGRVAGISHRYCTNIQRQDGYAYA